jgi:hypothetical protein
MKDDGRLNLVNLANHHKQGWVMKLKGENTIKIAKGVKVKSIFPRITHHKCHFCVDL